MRAQKPKGSVVYNRSRATWNYLFIEGGKRKSRKLGTLSDLPTKADAIRKAEAVKRERRLVAGRSVPTIAQLVEGYKAERMPKRYSTSRSYESWLDNYILPRWGASAITDLKPRPWSSGWTPCSCLLEAKGLSDHWCMPSGTMRCGATRCQLKPTRPGS